MTQAVPLAVTKRVWLTVSEARQVTGVGANSLYAALQTGELKGTQRGRKGRWRIHCDDLDAWMRGEH